MPGGNGANYHEHCPKHGKNDPEIGPPGTGGQKESPSNVNTVIEAGNNPGGPGAGPGGAPGMGPAPAGGNGAGGAGGATGPGGKKHDPKEIMKKRRERAICIDRVSRVIFPSTFILLNIIYWLVFSEILDAIKYSVGADDESKH